MDYVIASLDTAYTEKSIDKKGDPDPTACGVWGVFQHEQRANIVLLDCWEDHLGMPALIKRVKRELNVPILTDVHDASQVNEVASVVDVLQTPAFLCRQTDFIRAVAQSGKPVNIKKGQFLAPWDMKNVVNKLVASGCRDVLVCERGVSFGYNTLVSDMRAIPELAATGAPVVFDATHSVQQPGGQGTTSGGQRQFVPVLARAAAAVGVAAVFIETHENPDIAPSDGPNMVPLHQLEELMSQIMAFDKLAKSYN